MGQEAETPTNHVVNRCFSVCQSEVVDHHLPSLLHCDSLHCWLEELPDIGTDLTKWPKHQAMDSIERFQLTLDRAYLLGAEGGLHDTIELLRLGDVVPVNLVLASLHSQAWSCRVLCGVADVTEFGHLLVVLGDSRGLRITQDPRLLDSPTREVLVVSSEVDDGIRLTDVGGAVVRVVETAQLITSESASQDTAKVVGECWVIRFLDELDELPHERVVHLRAMALCSARLGGESVAILVEALVA